MPTRGRIPGVTGKRIPGTKNAIPRSVGGMVTSVPWQDRGSDVFREYHHQQVRDSKGRFAGGWGIAWQGLAACANGLVDYLDHNLDTFHRAMDQLAERMEQYAKDNHPWQNRTGDAEAGLHAEVVHEGDTATIWLGHGVDYGIWLEIMQGGRFAIILPTVQQFAGEIGATMRSMV